MLTNLTLILILIVFLKVIFDFFSLNRSIIFLDNIKKKINSSNTQKKLRLTIFIPVLNEHEMVNSLKSQIDCLGFPVKIVFVTTTKEEIQKKQKFSILENNYTALFKDKNLKSLIEKCLGIFSETELRYIFNKKLSRSKVINLYKNKETTKTLLERAFLGYQNINILNFPGYNRDKGEQLNWALREYYQQNDYNSDDFLVFYDADSTIDKNLFKNIQKYLACYPEAKAFQQSAIYFKNYSRLSNSILKGVSLFQSKWTLVNEITRIRRQATTRIGNYFESAHVVGHGLIINTKIFFETGLFPESHLTEDMPLIIKLRSKIDKIYLYPTLEDTESPKNISGMFNMYMNWYFGVVGYIKYGLNILQTKGLRMQLLCWVLIHLYRALSWLMFSFIWILIFIVSFLTLNPILTLTVIVLFFLSSYVSYLFMLNKLVHYNHIKPDSVNRLPIFANFAVYFTHSYGPVMALYSILIAKINSVDIIRNKTQR